MGSTPTDAHGHGEVHQHAHNPAVAHEHSDINIRGVLLFVAILTGTALVIHVAMYVLFIGLNRLEAANDATGPFVAPITAPVPGKLFPEPNLQTVPWSDLRKFRADEDAYLDSFGWVDQHGGVAHIPIDKAKDLLLQRGVPSRPGEIDPHEGTHFASYGEASGGSAIPAGGADMSTPQAAAPGASGPGAGGASNTSQTQGQTGQAPKKPGGGK